MQWKVHPADADVECLFQSFNTPGTEVAPGSDVVTENFEGDRCVHRLSFQKEIRALLPLLGLTVLSIRSTLFEIFCIKLQD